MQKLSIKSFGDVYKEIKSSILPNNSSFFNLVSSKLANSPFKKRLTINLVSSQVCIKLIVLMQIRFKINVTTNYYCLFSVYRDINDEAFFMNKVIFAVTSFFHYFSLKFLSFISRLLLLIILRRKEHFFRLYQLCKVLNYKMI